MPADQEHVQYFRERLVGQFTRVDWRVDVISRITQVELSRSDGSIVYIGNQMIDIAEREESGQIELKDESEELTTDSPASFDFAPDGISLTKLWLLDTDIGTLVTGLSFADAAGNEIQILTAAEVCCLFVSIGPFKSKSESEYDDSAYRIVSI